MARGVAIYLCVMTILFEANGFAFESASTLPLTPYALNALDILSGALRIHQGQHSQLTDLLNLKQTQLSAAKEQIASSMQDLKLSLETGFLPVMSPAEVLLVISEDFGQQPHQLFFGLNPEAPLMTSAGSQTFKAYVPVTGVGKFGLKPVLVKVRRPNYVEVVRRNRQIRNLLLHFARSLLTHPELRELLETIERDSVYLEEDGDETLDFTDKSGQALSLRKMIPYVPRWWIPVPVPSHIRSRVMTVSFMPGQNQEQISFESEPGRKNLIRRAINKARQPLRCQNLF